MSNGTVIDISADIEVSNMRLEFFDSGGVEMKWCLFAVGKRASIGKVIVDIPGNVSASPAHSTCSSIESPSLSSIISTSKTAHIKSVFIHKDYRSKGLSKYLINRCKLSLSENGFDRIILEAEEDVSRYGKLVKLYEECGFHVIGDESNIKYEYNDDQCFRKVPMECWIKSRLFRQSNESQRLEKSSPYTLSAYSSEASTIITENMNVNDGNFNSNANNHNDQIMLLVLEMGSEEHIRELRTHMTNDFVLRMKEEALVMNRAQMTVIEALYKLNEKDPGSLSRAIFTAEFIREEGHPDWLQFAGLVSELGRIQENFLWTTPYTIEKQRRARARRAQLKQVRQNSASLQQTFSASSLLSSSASATPSLSAKIGSAITHSSIEKEEDRNHKDLEQESDVLLMEDLDDDLLLGDSNFVNQKGWPLPEWSRADFTETWVTGCKLPDTLPYASTMNQLNPDQIAALASDSPEIGQYYPQIGMDNINMSWNKDEYLSIILSENESLGLPSEAINVIRFHRLISWIDQGYYKELMDDNDDEQTLEWTKLYRDLLKEATSAFNAANIKDPSFASEERMSFINSLVEKYYPGVLKW